MHPSLPGLGQQAKPWKPRPDSACGSKKARLFLPIPHRNFFPGPYGRQPQMQASKAPNPEWSFEVFYRDSSVTCLFEPAAKLVWMRETVGGREILLTEDETLSLMEDLNTFQMWKEGHFVKEEPYNEDSFGVVYSSWLTEEKVSNSYYLIKIIQKSK